MSGFGDDVLSAQMKISEKGLDLLLKLLRFLESRKNLNNFKSINMDEKIKAEKLKEITLEKKINMQSGKIDNKLLSQSKEPLHPIAVKLNYNELMKLHKYAKIYGYPFSAIGSGVKPKQVKSLKQELKKLTELAKKEGLTEQQVELYKELNKKIEILSKERDDYTIIVREKDLSLIKESTDRMNEDIKLNDIDKEIEELENKEDRTPAEEAVLENLKKEKEDVLKSSISDFNKESADIIFNDVCNNMQSRSLSFDRALNRFTDRDFSSEQATYVCERTNPNSYIEMKSSLAEYKGYEYTKTDYEVYNNGIRQIADERLRKDGKFSDERFESRGYNGRGVGFWENLKNDIKEKGNFTDDVVIFSNKEEFDKYRELYNKEIEKNILNESTTSLEIDNESFKDCAGIINQLKARLNEHNLDVNEKQEICKADTKEVVILDDNMLDDEKYAYVDSVNIIKQISTYKELNVVQTQLAMEKQELINNIDDKELSGRIEEKIEELKLRKSELEKEAEKLKDEAKQICGVKASNEVIDESIVERHDELTIDEFTHGEDEKSSMEQWNEKVEEDINVNNVVETNIDTDTISIDNVKEL